MPDSIAVLRALRNDLVDAGLVRRPNDAGPVPPLHVEPLNGPPAPGDREGLETLGDIVVTLRLSTEAPMSTGRAFLRLFIVDVVFRSKGSVGFHGSRALDAAIRARLVEGASYGTGVMLDEGGPAALFVHELRVWAGLGPVSSSAGIRTELAKYSLEVLA